MVREPRWDEPSRVRCQGEWHLVRIGPEGLIVAHGEDEFRRERALGALGGATSGCFRVARMWREGARLPRWLRHHRQELFRLADSGYGEELVSRVDGGFDPRVVDGQGRTLMHCATHLDEWVLERLHELGTPADQPDRIGRTPLVQAVYDGSPRAVRFLLRAGVSEQSVTKAVESLDLARRWYRVDLGAAREMGELLLASDFRQ